MRAFVILENPHTRVDHSREINNETASNWERRYIECVGARFILGGILDFNVEV